MSVITTKNRPKRQVVVKDAGHPAAFNKIRCPKCSLGYAVKSMTEPDKFTCERCHTTFTVGKL